MHRRRGLGAGWLWEEPSAEALSELGCSLMEVDRGGKVREMFPSGSRGGRQGELEERILPCGPEHIHKLWEGCLPGANGPPHSLGTEKRADTGAGGYRSVQLQVWVQTQVGR